MFLHKLILKQYKQMLMTLIFVIFRYRDLHKCVNLYFLKRIRCNFLLSMQVDKYHLLI